MSPTKGRREVPHRRSSVRHAQSRAAVVALALVSSLLGATTLVLAEAPASRPISPLGLAFTPIDPEAFGAPSAEPTADATPITGAVAGVTSTNPYQEIADFGVPEPLTEDQARDAYGQPGSAARDADVNVQLKPTPAPKAQPAAAAKGKTRARGEASWYCLTGVSACHKDYSGGMYAAAGPALRVGNWRGRVVTVCQGGDCIRVRLVDWCGCPGRVIDLYGDAFRRLGSLSSGVIQVIVRW